MKPKSERMITNKVVDDYDNMIFDPSQNKWVPGHKVIQIDGLTGEEVLPEKSIQDQLEDNRRQQHDRLRREIQLEIDRLRGEGYRPTAGDGPRAFGGKTGPQVLSEFVRPGGGESNTKTTQTISVGPRSTAPETPIEPTAQKAANSLNSMFGSMEAAMAQLAPASMENGGGDTIVTDIPGATYAAIALAEVENMKALGHRHAFVDIDLPVGSGQRTMAEFKATLADNDISVETTEMCYHSGGPSYKVLLMW